MERKPAMVAFPPDFFYNINNQYSMNMKRFFTASLVILLSTVWLSAQQRELIWPKGKMPHPQDHQIAAMTNEVDAKGFKPKKHKVAYLDWYEKPANPNGACMILISGGGYGACCDVYYIEQWSKELTKAGYQCVNLVYRTPRPDGLPIYQSAWEDGQRGVRMVRSEAAKRGFDPEKIGTISMSAGSHLAVLLGTSSQTPAYEKVDAIDDIPCHINWAIVDALAYSLSDDEAGTASTTEGYGSSVSLSSVFKFDEKTCPMSFHHGGADVVSPNASQLVYRQLRRMGIPAELHIYPDKNHTALGLKEAMEFMTQMNFNGQLGEEVALTSRFTSDADQKEVIREDVWPEGQIPDFQNHQCLPYLEWHIPAVKKTDAIQIIYSGGAYEGNDPDGFEVAPARRYLNSLGMTVVTMKYRTPRPEGMPRYVTAWQDLQRAIRVVRSEAASRGLDPNRIGIMGSSAGGHLTLMGVTSSRHRSYIPIDEIDNIPCNVQWGIGIYPAYSLTDDIEGYNTTRGNADWVRIGPEFSYDLDTAPMLLIHGDADDVSAMNSVLAWQKMRSMGIQSELHTLALRNHCFQAQAAPGTGSYTWLEHIWDFLTKKGFNK